MVRNCLPNIDACRLKNGNCPILAEDGLSVQCVGPWSEDKYFILNNYLIATKGVRKQFFDKGNAIFIDLFSGPGKGIIRKEQREINSGAIIAINTIVPFNDYYFIDIEKINIEAIKARINSKANIYIEDGDSNVLVASLVEKLFKKSYKYHFAFIDPFSPDALKFSTITELARLPRMDLLIHFPMGSIKRNIPEWMDKQDTILDKFLGTTSWRDKIREDQSKVETILLDIYKSQLESIGYPESGLRLASTDNTVFSSLPVVSIKNTKDVELYVLILASKHPLAQKIWNSIIKTTRSGQRSFL